MNDVNCKQGVRKTMRNNSLEKNKLLRAILTAVIGIALGLISSIFILGRFSK